MFFYNLDVELGLEGSQLNFGDYHRINLEDLPVNEVVTVLVVDGVQNVVRLRDQNHRVILNCLGLD
jgi:hypothetical protein